MTAGIAFALLSLVVSRETRAQTISSSQAGYSTYFEEIKTAEQENTDLWKRDMYGPILLVNPKTREIYSNFPDADGALKQVGEIYSGLLPDNINISNTAVHWNGKDWAMVMLPLPADKQDRINLLAHELFHVAQPSLGFRSYSPDNNQLDEEEGRNYLRLELEALRKALESGSASDMRKHVADALTFREYRYMLYPHADSTENLLELNEGLAEYTGFVVSDRDKKESIYHFETSMNGFFNNPTFVRSFAYQTVPLYGYLLSQSDKLWNRKVTDKTNLTDCFIRAFDVSLPSDLKSAVESTKDQYDGRTIAAEEDAREAKRKALIAKYRQVFIEKPHLEIRFEHMHVSFDPRNILPLDNNGTVYPNIRVVDNWGILTVENGALMSPNWDRITVSAPTQIDGNKVAGDGWKLQLNDPYTVTEESNTGNYRVIKR